MKKILIPLLSVCLATAGGYALADAMQGGAMEGGSMAMEKAPAGGSMEKADKKPMARKHGMKMKKAKAKDKMDEAPAMTMSPSK